MEALLPFTVFVLGVIAILVVGWTIYSEFNLMLSALFIWLSLTAWISDYPELRQRFLQQPEQVQPYNGELSNAE